MKLKKLVKIMLLGSVVLNFALVAAANASSESNFGTIAGAVAGGVIGASVAGGGGKVLGAGVGAAVGGITGNQLGKAVHRHREKHCYDKIVRTKAGQQQLWRCNAHGECWRVK